MDICIHSLKGTGIVPHVSVVATVLDNKGKHHVVQKQLSKDSVATILHVISEELAKQFTVA